MILLQLLLTIPLSGVYSNKIWPETSMLPETHRRTYRQTQESNSNDQFLINYWSPIKSDDDPNILRNAETGAEIENDPTLSDAHINIFKQKIITHGHSHGHHIPSFPGSLQSHTSVINHGIGGLIPTHQLHNGFSNIHGGGLSNIHGGGLSNIPGGGLSNIHGGGLIQNGFSSGHNQAILPSHGGLISNGFASSHNQAILPTHGGLISNDFTSINKHSSVLPTAPLIDVRGGLAPTKISHATSVNTNTVVGAEQVERLDSKQGSEDESLLGERSPADFTDVNTLQEEDLGTGNNEGANDVDTENHEQVPDDMNMFDNRKIPIKITPVKEENISPPGRFETDTNSQIFDPFNEREHVMDFLDHHLFRQTPYVPFKKHMDPSIQERAVEENSEREAWPEPTHKLKKYNMPVIPYSDSYHYAPAYDSYHYPSYQSYYYPGYVGAEFTSEELSERLDSEREASPEPTLKKLKKLKKFKMPSTPYYYYPLDYPQSYHYPQYESNYYPDYVGAELMLGDPSEESSFDREASPEPTHKFKKLKKYKTAPMPYYYHPQPHYPSYQSHNYPGYVGMELRQEAALEEPNPENFDREITPETNDEAREASPQPTLHKKLKLKKYKYPPMHYQYQHQQYPQYHHFPPNYGRNAAEETDPGVSAPNLFRVPSRIMREEWRRKRDANDSLESDIDKIHDLVTTNTTLEEMMETMTDIGVKILQQLAKYNKTEEMTKEESKHRARRSVHEYENEKDVLRKSKKTTPPFSHQKENKHDFEKAKHKKDLKKEQRTIRQSSPIYHVITDPNTKLDVPKTLDKFGVVSKHVMDDQRSPLHHMKNLIGSSRDTLVSSMRMPPQGLVPSGYRLVKVDDDDEQVEDFNDLEDLGGQMVHKAIRNGVDTISHIGDITHSAKNIIHKSKNTVPRVVVPYSRAAVLQKSHHGREKSEDNTIDNAEDPKLSIGAKNLRNFLVKMKKEFTKSFNFDPPKKTKCSTNNDQVVDTFLEDLFDKKEEVPKNQEIVGAGLNLPEELYHPFMGRASKKQLKDYLRKNNNEDVVGISNRNSKPPDSKTTTLTVNNEVLGDFLEYLRTKNQTPRQYEDLGYVLGAINPLMFERNFNQTLVLKNSTDPHTFFGSQEADGRNHTVGTFMTVTGPALRPFMGQAQPQNVEDLMETYNDEDYIEYNDQ